MAWKIDQDVQSTQNARVQLLAARLAQHPRYRKILAELDLDASRFRTIADLDLLPLTGKQDLVDDPEGFRLEVDPNHAEDYVLWDVAYTAGTSTGRPTPIFQTAYDFRAILFAQKRMAEIRGMTRDDRIANLYPLAATPHGGWIRPTQAAAVIGASVVVGMGGSPDQAFAITRRMDEIVDVVAGADSTVLWGVPSYLLRVLHRVAERGLRLESLRLLACSGEPCRPRLRQALVSAAEAVSGHQVGVSDSLGATELQFSLVECPAGGGFHNPAPELAHVGVVDDDGRSLPSGEAGRLVYSHLDRRGTFLLRYLIGDRAIVDHGPCPHCGWPGGRVVEHLGREGSYVKVRGNIVGIDALFAILDGLEFVSDYRATVHKPNDDPLAMDALTIDVVFDLGGGTESDALERVSAAVRDVAGIRADVRTIAADQLWRPEDRMKPVRFIDSRPLQ